MKFPNNIILDISKPFVSLSNKYWVIKYLNNSSSLNSLTTHQRYYLNKDLLLNNRLVNSKKKFTVKYSLSNPFKSLSETHKQFYISFFEPKIKVGKKYEFSKHLGKEIYNFYSNSILKKIKFDEKSLKKLLVNFKFDNNVKFFKTNKLWFLFDINFIRKEKIYTKLKYSRVPQYDIVSGGVAAIFAGFLGFLICEKFGFELIDSGDFYFLFMYVVFLCFFLRLFLKIITIENNSWHAISLKWAINFYNTILSLFIKYCKFLYFLIVKKLK